MSAMSGDSLSVLRGFVSAANAQYRAAGLGEHQMRVSSTGKVTTPSAPDPSFKDKASPASSTTQTSAAKQSTAGAAQVAAPQPTAVENGGTDAFRISWKPVAGATAYGIWQDGKLIGSVSQPSFAGQLAPDSKGTIQIDAQLANGARSARTPALVVTRTGSAALAFSGAMAQAVAGAAAAAPAAARTAATAPA
jgi:hypothetical protein